MHSRAPTDAQITSYEAARDGLNSAIDDFFQKWSIESGNDGGWPWDYAARKAVQRALESADWDEENKKIEFDNEDEVHHMPQSVRSQDELQSYLEGLARSAFYSHYSGDADDWAAECDEESIVEGVLADYEDRLTKLFAPPDEDDGKG